MRIKKYIPSITIIIVTIIISLSYNFFKTNNNNKAVNLNQNPDNSVGIDLKDSIGNESNLNFNIKNNKAVGSITIINNTKYNLNFTLTSFIDYSQIEFLIDNTIRDNFTFNLNKHSQKTFQIAVNTYTPNNNHILNFVLYNNSKIKHDIKDHIIFTPLVTKHNLIINKNLDFVQSNLSFNNDNIKLQGKADKPNVFKLNGQDSDSLKETEIHAKKDQIVSIPTNITNFDDSKDYAFWLTLNGKQLTLNNNLKYWYFKLPNQFTLNKNVTFKAPNNKGTYDLIGFLITNPFVKKGDIKKHSNIVTSSKIKLIVD